MQIETAWNERLVAISVFIAIIGSYVALDFAGRLKASKNWTRKLWFVGGALTMGLAIYTMHFLGMLALKMQMTVSYDPALSILSLVAAVSGSGIAFAVISRKSISKFHLIFGGLAMGMAIASMHYIGMAAMQMSAIIQYNPLLFGVSIFIAIFASVGALWLAFQMRTEKLNIWFYQKVASAVIMGVAISGMHYTGMAAASYRMVNGTMPGMGMLPMVGPFNLWDVLTVASVFFGVALLLLGTQASVERQKALEQAMENERRFLATFEQAAVGIAEVGLNGSWLKLNRKYCEILGYSQDEMLESTFQDVTHPEDLQMDLNFYRKLIAQEITQYPIEKRYIRKDKSSIWVKLSVSLVVDEQNKPLYVIAVAEDISDKKAAEDLLKKSVERELLAADIIDSIRSEIDLETILHKTVDSIGKFTQADRCRIWLFDTENQQFQATQYEYRSRSLISENDTTLPTIAILQSMLNYPKVASFPDILQVEDLTEQDCQFINECGVKSLLHVPILYKDTLLGALRIYSIIAKSEWDTETVSQVKSMAAQAAIAIHYAKTLQELRDSESKKTGILESSLDAIITMDHNGIVCEWNASAERILGYNREDAIGRPLADLIIPEQYRQAHYQGLAHYLATGEGPLMNKLLELPALKSDGKEFLAELTIARVRMADPPIFTGTLRDITERKQAEAEIQQLTKNLEKRVDERTRELQDEILLRQKTEETLRLSEERSRLLIETVRDYAIFRLDSAGNIVSWNAGAERIKGYAADEIIGKHFSIFYSPESVEAGYPEFELRTAEEQGRFEDEGWRFRKDGSRFWANVVITALYNAQKQLIGFSKITRDLTERKKLEDELVARSQQLEISNKELEAFSYSVSHDLRAPLRTIDGFSHIILKMYSDKLDDRGRDYLNRMRQDSQYMAQLIDDLLKLSRLTRGELDMHEGVNLSQMAIDISNSFQKAEAQRQVTVEVEDNITVRGDQRLLRVVLENLLSNSWKYTSKHPTACIKFGTIQSPGTSIYYVKDDGAGFDMRYADKLFGAFQRLHGTAEFPGTGVGLATASRIIHRHGGEIWAEGQVEKGATFYFTLQPVDLKELRDVEPFHQSYSSR